MRLIVIASAVLAFMACTTEPSSDGLPSAVRDRGANGEATDADEGSSAGHEDGGAAPSTSSGGSGGSSGTSGTSGGSSGTSGGSSGTSGTSGGSSGTSGGSSSGGTSDPYALARKACVDAVNKYRAMKGLSALTLYAGKQACADQQASVDAAHPTQPHYAYLNGAPSCIENNVLDRQNECPGWYDPADKAAADCVAKMWAEGPGTGPAHGHYNVLVNPQYSRLSCGFAKRAGAPPSSALWIVFNFY